MILCFVSWIMNPGFVLLYLVVGQDTYIYYGCRWFDLIAMEHLSLAYI